MIRTRSDLFHIVKNSERKPVADYTSDTPRYIVFVHKEAHLQARTWETAVNYVEHIKNCFKTIEVYHSSFPCRDGRFRCYPTPLLTIKNND